MIYFVGAGPGAVDLISVRGERLLKQADVVIYAGSLVNPELLNNCKPGCAKYDSAGMTLGDVIDVMKADQGIIVRLHTGDPSIYGAIREQMDALRALNRAFEIVPGISSFCAAAAALEAEYTLPGVSQTVIISRMAGRTPVPEREQIEALASHGATMVLFLSAGMIPELCLALVRGGYRADTPCAIVYRASWPDQLVIRGNLHTIADMAKAQGIGRQALVCVGDFLGDDYELSKLYDASFAHGYREAAK